MTPVLVDSNILIDIATDDPHWAAWSAEALAREGQGARLVINPLIYAEVSVAHARIETLDALLPEEVFAREPLPWAAGFLAGKVFITLLQHRKSKSDYSVSRGFLSRQGTTPAEAFSSEHAHLIAICEALVLPI